MSEEQKIIEQERKGVVELLLKKNGLTRRQLVEELVGIWTASMVERSLMMRKSNSRIWSSNP